MSPDEKVLLAVVVAGGSILLASRVRSDLSSGLALVLGLGTAQWLAATAHEERYPEVTVSRLERLLTGTGTGAASRRRG